MMKEVHRKAIDATVNQLLVSAYRSKTPLIWDRSEAMQPQCGFGRLSICCSDCQDGPCRTNPFSETTQQTSCGRDSHDLASHRFLHKTADGLLALVKLAQEQGAAVNTAAACELLVSNDEMADATASAGRLRQIGHFANTVLEQLCNKQYESEGGRQPAVTGVNLGVLQSDTINILLHGHVSPKVAENLKAAASSENIEINLTGMCGNEFSGSLQLPAVANYGSQELPLLTGLVDLLVTGSQCVMPSLYSLADKQNIPALRITGETTEDDYQTAVLAALQAWKRRRTVSPAAKILNKGSASIGYTAANSSPVFQNLVRQYRQGKLRGVVYLGGCGIVANTQDELPVQFATALVNAGYLVLTAGCAGTALARAGLCHPDWQNRNHTLQSSLPPATPPVLHLGSCRDAGEFLRIASLFQQDDIPVAAIFPEINHNKVLTTAVGFAAAGIPSWLPDETASAGIAQSGLPLFPLGDAQDLLAQLEEQQQ